MHISLEFIPRAEYTAKIGPENVLLQNKRQAIFWENGLHHLYESVIA